MSLQFITGNSGNGKTKYLFNRIVKEAKANPRDNYLVIVPEQFTMQTQRQLVDLSENKAIMNIDVLSFKRLAYRVFDELGITNLTVLEETGKNLVLRKLAAQEADKLGVIGRNLNRIGYISEVKSLLSELVQYNISPEELGRYIASGRLSDTLSDIGHGAVLLREGRPHGLGVDAGLPAAAVECKRLVPRRAERRRVDAPRQLTGQKRRFQMAFFFQNGAQGLHSFQRGGVLLLPADFPSPAVGAKSVVDVVDDPAEPLAPAWKSVVHLVHRLRQRGEAFGHRFQPGRGGREARPLVAGRVVLFEGGHADCVS